MAWALSKIDINKYDAFVILDADTIVNQDFLKEFNMDLNIGKEIIQGYDGVIVTKNNWLARLAHLSDILQFYVYLDGRHNLGLPVRLLGNAMCFSKRIIEKYAVLGSALLVESLQLFSP